MSDDKDELFGDDAGSEVDTDDEDDLGEVDMEALQAMIDAEEDDDVVLTRFAEANEALKTLEAKHSEELAPLNADNLLLTKTLIDFMEASNIDAIGIGTNGDGDADGDDAAPDTEKKSRGEEGDDEASECGGGGGGAGPGPWYLRLSYPTCAGEKPCPKLFSSVLADLTPESFMAKVEELEEDRAARREAWEKARRTEVIKQLRKDKREWVKAQSVQVKPLKRLKTRTSAAKAMADTAAALGAGAIGGVDVILKAGQKRSAIVGLGEDDGGGSEIGMPALKLGKEAPDPTNEAQIAALMGPLPVYEAVLYRNGKNGSKFPIRGKLPLVGALTNRQLLAEVLYCMIVERTKGRKAKLTVTACKGRPKVLVEGSLLRGDVRTHCIALREAREAKAAAARRGRRERAMQKAIMTVCEPRVRAYLDTRAHDDFKEKRIMESEGVKRTLIIQKVEEPKLRKPINMWDVSTLVEASVEAALPASVLDAVFGDGGGGGGGTGGSARVTDMLKGEVTSKLLATMLRKTSDLETERTIKVTRVKINRFAATAVPGPDATGAAAGTFGARF